MVSLYKDPKGEKIFKSNMGSQDTGITFNTSKYYLAWYNNVSCKKKYIYNIYYIYIYILFLLKFKLFKVIRMERKG